MRARKRRTRPEMEGRKIHGGLLIGDGLESKHTRDMERYMVDQTVMCWNSKHESWHRNKKEREELDVTCS